MFTAQVIDKSNDKVLATEDCKDLGVAVGTVRALANVAVSVMANYMPNATADDVELRIVVGKAIS